MAAFDEVLPGQALLHIKEFCLWCGKKKLLDGIDMQVRSGEIMAILGVSGVGKSSFLHWVLGVTAPPLRATGHLILAGQDITDMPAYQRRIAILLQDDMLFPHLSVEGNLSIALPRHYKGKARQTRIQDALAAVEMQDFGKRDPAGLSGGERARIALMRALLSEPLVLLLDEPFAKMDVVLRQTLYDYTRHYVDRQRLATLLVTHDSKEVEALAKKQIAFHACE